MGDLAHEVGERDRNRDDRLLDPVILQENGLCGDVAAGLPKHAAEHEATGSRLALGLALIVAGGLLSGSSIFLMGRAWRMGLDPDNRTELAENGPYRWIRHPIYSGWLLVLLGNVLLIRESAIDVAAAVTALGVFMQAIREEQHMFRTIGERYARYATRTGRFAPRLWRR